MNAPVAPACPGRSGRGATSASREPSLKPALHVKTPTTLEEWLAHIERVHPQSIDMGLDRVAAVRDALRLAPRFPLLTVGGTNGKGSASAMLESILHSAGYRVGCYTSPHLLRYNERVRIGRREVEDADLCRALAAVDEARGATVLTYFEFSTLAALWLFAEARVDAAILEVGLGGRLDAVNAFDADCALVMTVDIDHVDYLGATREAIGREKAGIFRAGRPAVCADRDPPRSLVDHAAGIGARLLTMDVDFGYAVTGREWRYWGPGGERHVLPHPALRGGHQLGNAAACLAALDTLADRLPVTMSDVRTGLLDTENPGRFQVLPGRPMVVLDVAHNPEAARALAGSLAELPGSGRTLAVFAMLGDKDIDAVIGAVCERIDAWYVAGIVAPRGASADTLQRRLSTQGIVDNVTVCDDIAAAYALACKCAGENDKIVVFGSFHTVAQVMAARRETL
jgi:dihydrofolate synthase/folylpolyglutamate synthase